LPAAIKKTLMPNSAASDRRSVDWAYIVAPELKAVA
jgi:hypothetical protein